MTTLHRRKRSELAGRITQAAIEAFRAGDVLALHRELRLPPWQVSPLAVEGDCPWPAGTAGCDTWPDSTRLREQLEAAS